MSGSTSNQSVTIQRVVDADQLPRAERVALYRTLNLSEMLRWLKIREEYCLSMDHDLYAASERFRGPYCSKCEGGDTCEG